MPYQILNTIGLLFSIAGVALLFHFAWPQPSFEEGEGLGLEGGTRLPDGRTVDERDADVLKLKRQYERRSRLALSLIIFGFVLQLSATWVC
jgi:hypothetical protein